MLLLCYLHHVTTGAGHGAEKNWESLHPGADLCSNILLFQAVDKGSLQCFLSGLVDWFHVKHL